MNFKIVYDSPSRLRLRCGGGVFQPEQEAALASALTDIDGVCSVSVSSVNGGILLYYNGDIKDKILKDYFKIQDFMKHYGIRCYLVPVH